MSVKVDLFKSVKVSPRLDDEDIAERIPCDHPLGLLFCGWKGDGLRRGVIQRQRYVVLADELALTIYDIGERRRRSCGTYESYIVELDSVTSGKRKFVPVLLDLEQFLQLVVHAISRSWVNVSITCTRERGRRDSKSVRAVNPGPDEILQRCEFFNNATPSFTDLCWRGKHEVIVD